MRETEGNKQNKTTRITFIGGGSMGGAMIGCLLAKKVSLPQSIAVSDISPARRELLAREYGVNTFTDNRDAAKDADLIILAVKPQNLSQVMSELKGLTPHQLVVSVAAGTKLNSLSQGLGHRSVIRAMPNMPAQIGEGMTVWTATAETEDRHKQLAQTMLAALGKEIYVPDEKYVDMATALSASGPAYVFLFIEAFIDAGVHIGLPRDMAQTLVIQTILGATRSVERTGRHPAELRNMVTSPGGTTTEALLELERGRFRSLLFEAVAAAHEKAKRL